jgi:lysyl-tRNA synthetase class 2
MITELKKNPETNPYPHKFHVTQTVSQFIKHYSPLCAKGEWLDQETSIAGRVFNIRKQGKNLVFIDIQQEAERLQVMCNSNNHKGNRNFEELYSTIRRGDIIGVVGRPGRTNTDELSIAPGELKLLSPCLHMLPDVHTGFTNR